MTRTLTVYLVTPDDRCPRCKKQHLPLWRHDGRAGCASCLSKEIPVGGAMHFASYATQNGGAAVPNRDAA